MLGIFLTGGVAGNMLSTVTYKYTIGVGASGGVFAIVSAMLVWYWLNYQRIGTERRNFLLILLILNLVTLLMGMLE
jgi:membrane associated rhomboid family serine protease